MASVTERYRLPILTFHRNYVPFLRRFLDTASYLSKSAIVLPARVWRPIFDNCFAIAKTTHELTCVVDGIMIIRTSVCERYRHMHRASIASRSKKKLTKCNTSSDISQNFMQHDKRTHYIVKQTWGYADRWARLRARDFLLVLISRRNWSQRT